MVEMVTCKLRNKIAQLGKEARRMSTGILKQNHCRIERKSKKVRVN